MKYCNNCNLNIDNQHKHCPLCGGKLYQKAVDKSTTFFDAMQRVSQRPTFTVNKISKSYVNNKVNACAIVLFLICLSVDLILVPPIRLSGYIGIILLVLTNNIFSKMIKKGNFASKITATIILLTLTAIISELSISNQVNINVSLYEVLPFVFSIALLLIDIAFIYHRHNIKGLYGTLTLCTVFCITPQIVRIVKHNQSISNFSSILIMVLFVDAIVNFIAVKLMFRHYIKSEKTCKLRI